MTKKISNRDYRDVGVSAEPVLFTLTFKTWKSGTVSLQATPWELSNVCDQITAALKRHADDAARLLSAHAKDQADIASGART